jgi:hypothetical protein
VIQFSFLQGEWTEIFDARPPDQLEGLHQNISLDTASPVAAKEVARYCQVLKVGLESVTHRA